MTPDPLTPPADPAILLSVNGQDDQWRDAVAGIRMTGNELRELRESLGLYLREFAPLLDMSQRTLQRREELGDEEIPFPEAFLARFWAQQLEDVGGNLDLLRRLMAAKS